MTSVARRRPSLREIVTDRRLALMLALGYSSGLPFLLVYSTLSFWLRESHLSLSQIGLLSYVALSYSLKFLWAPIIDAVDLPLLAPLLGRRRAWMLTTQVCVALGFVFIAFSDPARSLVYVLVCSALTAFAAATQDVVIDAWRIDAAPVEQQGVMAATGNLGYRIAILCAQAGALALAELFGWRSAYLVMAALMLVGITACLLSPRLPDRVRTPTSAGGFAASFYAPVVDLARRNGLWIIAILLLVAIYRLPDFITGIMANPLYTDLHFTKLQVAGVSKGYGFWVSIAGAFAGGFALTRFGLMPALLVGGGAAASSHLALALLASTGDFLNPWVKTIGAGTLALHDPWVTLVHAGRAVLADPWAAVIGAPTLARLDPGTIDPLAEATTWWASLGPGRIDLLILSVSVENFAGGFAGSALIAYMSSLTSPAFAATQYALLSSLYSLPGKVVGGLSGVMVDRFGYVAFFVSSSMIGIPVMLLCLLMWFHSSRRTARTRRGQEIGDPAQPAASPRPP